MKVSVRFFAAAAEVAGGREALMEVPEGSTVGELLARLADRYPGFRRLMPHLQVAVNLAYAPLEAVLGDGDEVALLPPVSGGGEPSPTAAELTESPIDPVRLWEAVAHPDAGAVLLFAGTVRRRTGERETAFLEYDAYVPMALQELEAVLAEARRRWPGCRAAAAHRTGRLGVGEASVVVAVSAPHRDEAYAASRFIIDSLKARVPIWKREHRPDGAAEWVHPGGG